jgi:hypothetical protein
MILVTKPNKLGTLITKILRYIFEEDYEREYNTNLIFDWVK